MLIVYLVPMPLACKAKIIKLLEFMATLQVFHHEPISHIVYYNKLNYNKVIELNWCLKSLFGHLGIYLLKGWMYL